MLNSAKLIGEVKKKIVLSLYTTGLFWLSIVLYFPSCTIINSTVNLFLVETYPARIYSRSYSQMNYIVNKILTGN